MQKLLSTSESLVLMSDKHAILLSLLCYFSPVVACDTSRLGQLFLTFLFRILVVLGARIWVEVWYWLLIGKFSFSNWVEWSITDTTLGGSLSGVVPSFIIIMLLKRNIRRIIIIWIWSTASTSRACGDGVSTVGQTMALQTIQSTKN